MFCPACGKEVSSEYTVCPFCGKPVNAPQPQQPVYQAQPQYTAPAVQLECNRSWIKVLLLTMVTCGIYGIVVYYQMSEDVNTICTPRDNKKMMNYLVATILLGMVTCGIYPLVWMHQFCNRIGDNLRARNIPTDFSATTFWLWNVLGSFIFVGPFIFMYKLFEATNQLAADYNARG